MLSPRSICRCLQTVRGLFGVIASVWQDANYYIWAVGLLMWLVSPASGRLPEKSTLGVRYWYRCPLGIYSFKFLALSQLSPHFAFLLQSLPRTSVPFVFGPCVGSKLIHSFRTEFHL